MTAEPTAHSLLTAGHAHALAGRYAQAEADLIAALAQLRGSESESESKACGNLGSVFAITGRRFEAIFLYRRGLAIARSLGDLPLQIRHLANICAKYAEFRQWSRLADLLDETDRTVDRLPPEQRDAASDLALHPRLQLAVEHKDLSQARKLATRFQAAYGQSEYASNRMVALDMEAELCLLVGEPDKALEFLQRARLVRDLQPVDLVFVDCHTIGCLRELGRREEARRLARETLPRLEKHVSRNGVGEMSIELATELAAYLTDDPSEGDLAVRAYDIAATAVLSRISSLERCARHTPEICVLSAEDRELLTELRDRYRLTQQTLLDHVAGLVARGAAPSGSVLQRDESWGVTVRICSSCARVRSEHGDWLPVAHYVPANGDVVASHGLCSSCATRFGSGAGDGNENRRG